MQRKTRHLYLIFLAYMKLSFRNLRNDDLFSEFYFDEYALNQDYFSGFFAQKLELGMLKLIL